MSMLIHPGIAHSELIYIAVIRPLNSVYADSSVAILFLISDMTNVSFEFKTEIILIFGYLSIHLLLNG